MEASPPGKMLLLYQRLNAGLRQHRFGPRELTDDLKFVRHTCWCGKVVEMRRDHFLDLGGPTMLEGNLAAHEVWATYQGKA